MRINRSHLTQRFGFYQTLLDPKNKISGAEEFLKDLFKFHQTKKQ